MLVEFKSFGSHTLYFLIVLLASSRSNRVEGLGFLNIWRICIISHRTFVQCATLSSEISSQFRKSCVTLIASSAIRNKTPAKISNSIILTCHWQSRYNWRKKKGINYHNHLLFWFTYSEIIMQVLVKTRWRLLEQRRQSTTRPKSWALFKANFFSSPHCLKNEIKTPVPGLILFQD